MMQNGTPQENSKHNVPERGKLQKNPEYNFFPFEFLQVIWKFPSNTQVIRIATWFIWSSLKNEPHYL